MSINLLAEQLDNTDEIIFVDWNTEEGAATLPQAVAAWAEYHARTNGQAQVVENVGTTREPQPGEKLIEAANGKI